MLIDNLQEVKSTYYKLEDVCGKLQSMVWNGERCNLGDRQTVEFTDGENKVEVRGIFEDFDVSLNGQKVCEFVYDNLYNVNYELAEQLVS